MGNTSIKQLTTAKPPNEPPPPLEETYSKEEQQWVDDVIHTSTQVLKEEVDGKISKLYRTDHPQPHSYNIPTPKQSRNSFTTTNWSTNESIN